MAAGTGGKVALVTGAGMGIGRGVARRLAREGMRLLLADRDAGAGQDCAGQIRRDFGTEVEFVHADVTLRAEVEAMVQAALARWGTVHVLVNNAWGRRPGAGGLGPVEERGDADVEHAFRIGAQAALWAMQAAFPAMRAQRWGRVVNMCSLNGVNAHPWTLEYNMAKEALRTLTRTAAREWAPWGICCNAVCPGAATEAYRSFAAARPESAAAMLKLNPMGRMGDPEEDIGAVVLFLASEESRYLTGNTLFVDGGSHINGVPWVPELRAS
ncbi:SDR family NAD(P)-dependent oxidoreductase [Caldimonas tepidiphila]|uniref:SDR family NAD(P)-dependent oxidoreductase n=1 Tax=Caldimonas tepidiphila TaxID=2315841 RepID=UPI001F0C1DE7|nr:SDR family oxidoreductase [Caldimonas tepidiphila]